MKRLEMSAQGLEQHVLGGKPKDGRRAEAATGWAYTSQRVAQGKPLLPGCL